MNDFTKEELESLKDYINYAVSHSYGPTGDKVDRVYNKIQSLIDNYCEHEYYLNGCGENVIAQCHKCGHIGEIEFNE